MLAKWQKRLRLSDWDIRVHFDASLAVDLNCHGQANIWASRKAASIALDERMPATVVEDIVLHELLHVAFNTVQTVFDAHFDQWLAPGFRKLADDQLLTAEHALIENVRFALQGASLQCYEVDGAEWVSAFPLLEPWTK